MAAEETAFIIIAAFILDRMIGDPGGPLHPIRITGYGISFGVRAYKRAGIENTYMKFAAGALLTLIITGVAYAVTWVVTLSIYRFNYWLGLAVEALICCFLLAAKSLHDESMKVYYKAAAGDITGARTNLARIVGRDTENLSLPEIVKAAVETVAENLSDGVIAPLIFIFFGGAPLGMAYKAVNTLDSMIGYRDEQFEHFGKFAARLDDVVNFIPSRVSALMMILGSVYVNGADTGKAVRIFKRDRHNHRSPNAAQTESVCAGAFGLQLGGDHLYGGVMVHKPAIGDDINAPAPEYIIAANRLMYAAAANTAVSLTMISAAISILGGGLDV